MKNYYKIFLIWIKNVSGKHINALVFGWGSFNTKQSMEAISSPGCYLSVSDSVGFRRVAGKSNTVRTSDLRSDAVSSS